MNLVELKIESPDGSTLTRAEQALAQAEAFEVTTAEEYEKAAAELMAIKEKWRIVENERKALKQPIDEGAKRIQAFFKPPLDFLSKAEAIVKRKMIAWKSEQDRITREEQRKADERARKDREKLEEQARKAEEAGRTERAEVLRDRAISTVAAVPVTEAPKVSGIATRSIWRFRIVDASKVPDKYKIVDEKRIGGVVRALKGDADIPGVEVWEESTMAARSA